MTEASGPETQEKTDLRRLVTGIVRAQGNRFIKELLRENQLRIGSNKDEFEANLLAAVESGKLTLSAVAGWLHKVEGWGNQYVYLFNVSDELAGKLMEPALREQAEQAGLNVWGKSIVLEFPDEPSLTSISFRNGMLRLTWQEAFAEWQPVPELDEVRKVGLDDYLFRAHRQINLRALTRFEVRLADKLAALLIAEPITGGEHEKAVAKVWSDVGQLFDARLLLSNPVKTGEVSRNLDQHVVTNHPAASGVLTNKSRLAFGDAYVEFGTHARNKSPWAEVEIRNVRGAVKQPQIQKMRGEEGVFLIADQEKEPLRIELGKDGKPIRLRPQMKEDAVWRILNLLRANQ